MKGEAMKKKFARKLTLSKETLRVLTLAEPLPILGEVIETCYNSCPSICPCTR